MSFRGLVVCLAFVVGCSGEPVEEKETPGSERIACVGDFEATVRTGPSAGAEVYGGFALEEREDGSLSALIMTEGQEVEAQASMSSEGLELQIPMDDGTIVGLDPSVVDLESCPSLLEGDLVGPTEGDAGDWLARTTTVTSNGNTYTSTFDGNGVVVTIEITDRNGNTTILYNCNNQFQQGGC
jgi:hypothetical protein